MAEENIYIKQLLGLAEGEGRLRHISSLSAAATVFSIANASPSFILPRRGKTQRESYSVALPQFSAWRIAGSKSSRSRFVP
jgi:hypothetical protein